MALWVSLLTTLISFTITIQATCPSNMTVITQPTIRNSSGDYYISHNITVQTYPLGYCIECKNTPCHVLCNGAPLLAQNIGCMNIYINASLSPSFQLTCQDIPKGFATCHGMTVSGSYNTSSILCKSQPQCRQNIFNFSNSNKVSFKANYTTAITLNQNMIYALNVTNIELQLGSAADLNVIQAKTTKILCTGEYGCNSTRFDLVDGTNGNVSIICDHEYSCNETVILTTNLNQLNIVCSGNSYG